MIGVSDACAAVIDGRTYTLQARISVTRAGTVLAEDIPVATGTEEYDESLRVPELVRLSIPKTIRGVDMTPHTTDSPLAPYGQRIHVKLGVSVGPAAVEWIDRGEFLITDTDYDADVVQVQASGLLYLIDEARLLSPYAPATSFTATVRALVEPALTVVVDPAVAALDRAVPAAVAEDEDRLQCLLNVLTAWPARAQVSTSGYLHILPANTYPDGGQLLNTELDGVRANVAKVSGVLTRAGAANVMVTRGTATDGYQVLGVAFDYSGGPTSARSPFSPLPVPEFYASPLLTTASLAQTAALSRMQTRASHGARRYQAAAVPDPRWLGGDVITYRPDADTSVPLLVEHLVIPYTATSGPMYVTGREWTA